MFSLESVAIWHNYIIPYSGNSLQEEMFINHMILHSEEIFLIFEYYIDNKR